MPWMRSIFDTSGTPWWEQYSGPKPVIYGHHVHGAVLRCGPTWSLDTGCCHGERLSALILPGCEVVSVEARMDYWGKAKEDMAPFLASEHAGGRTAKADTRPQRQPLVV